VSSTKAHQDAVFRYRKKNIAQGLCRECPQPAISGQVMCKKHAEIERIRCAEKNRNIVQKRLENGLCTRCGTPLIEGEATRCVNCRIYDMVRLG
jgi:hypothetical protein